MKLSTRVSAFFLATLACALAVYSLLFYSMARRQIDFQFQRELHGVLHSLVAAAEIEETEVKWQPLEHTVSINALDEFGEVHWIIIGDRYRTVEKSANVDRAFQVDAIQLATDAATLDAGQEQTLLKNQFVYVIQSLNAPHPVSLDRELDEFDTLAVVVGRSTTKRDAIIWKLTTVVVVLPCVAWLVVAAGGRWIVRLALKPVTAMASQAQAIAGADFQSRLIVPGTNDQLEELGTTINRLLDRQQAAFEQQSRFAGNAAHELRTPITVLLGQIDVTLRRPRSTSEYVSTLELLRTTTWNFQEIVEALLFLARSDSESSLLSTQPLRLAEWVDEQSSVSWNRLSRASDLSIVNSLDRSVQVRGTSVLIGRIIDNLLTNAAKYSPPGSSIRIEASSEADQASIRVIDHGSGITVEDQQRLFEPFFRTSQARTTGVSGTGLGLAISNRIARALGGTLSVQSTTGRGSCFTLTLPIIR